MTSSKPTPSRTLSSEKTAAILEGAMQVFLEQGYMGTTMDRVAAAAGVSKPTVYNHFRDKETLFNALVEQWVHKTQWLTLPQEMLQSSSQSPEKVLRQLANNMLDSCIDSPEKVTFIRMILGESGRFPELGRAFVEHMDKPMLDVLTHYLSTHSEFNLPDPQAVAYSFAGTLIFFLMTHIMLHGEDILRMDRERLVNHLIAMSCGNNFRLEQ
ncbi:TetR/AcrR family transcriptional regulator [Leptolyngbya ohadii]|uniref:TetR/AcrR family transcriptional regulator n=1 Tax=Leptolyngbya ohadii TaxID=1962290 RepID=UPI000B5A1737|nr:TetR/AcrR family transcriptional regulator [Leptolyngbya ohadii]